MGSRTKNAKKNLIYVVCFQLVNIVVKFAMRTVFVYCLGKQYLGVNGVFSNVLTILSMTELGLGSAIVYDLYKPLKENDQVKITQQIRYFKKLYYYIGGIIFVVGMLLIPFLPVILTDVPDVEHITLIYVLYLTNTASSYFFAQYNSLISAAQKNYLITKIQMIFSVVKSLCESVFLLITKNYIVYLIIEIVLNIVSNFVIRNKAIKEFPFIKENVGTLDQESKKKIWHNTFNASSMKLAGTLIGGTDNLVTSSFVSTIIVGVYSNYYLIISIIQSATFMIEKAVMAGVGDLCVAEGEEESKQDLFYKLQFIYATIYMVIFSELFINLQTFIKGWLGNDYVLPISVVMVIIVNNYLVGIQQPIETFMYGDGLFRHFKYSPWIEVILNLAISIVLALKFGLIGVLLGTTISRLLVSFWYQAYVVYKYSLDCKYKGYWKKIISYFFVTIVAVGVNFLVLNVINFGRINLWIKLIGDVIVTFGISVVIWSLFFKKTKEFQYSLQILRGKRNVKDKKNICR